MQVSATLIAAQQAAREARARLQVPQAPQQASQQASKANFAAALEKTTGFSALPLKQMAVPAAPSAQPQMAAPARMGQHIDITV
jgi:hypothetical protein